ncbi:membrane protein [Bacillus sp. FJAT-27231]|uniref:spore germination protein n=1 Tax=Bacillus sp. FJAT-27231 TaxID=1679168 RepID=UPI0006709635|nr:spore germination protein [Bacillus sp. FJAT-27231]KMY54281.1 membrane protein [Bacillus sp. FJAT-27231]
MIRNVSKLLRQKKEKKRPDQREAKPQEKLHENFDQNVETFRSIYTNCSDVLFRSFFLFGKTRAMIIHIEGLSDVKGLEDYVLSPLMKETADTPQSFNEFLENKLSVSKVEKVHLLADCIESISSGNPILLCEGEETALSLGLAKWEKRSIEEPQAESSIRGPREGFIESLGVNTSLLRRIIKSPALKIQPMKIGEYTKTNVAVAYIEGLADPTLIKEVNNRLQRIEIDAVLESDYIEELIEDNPYSPFPQILSTERPDVACANLLEGRVIILVAGTPFVLIAPISFFSLMQVQEDYYQRFVISTFVRWLRYLFLGVALLLPSVYVAVATFHQEMVPTTLLLSIAASRETVPFPALVEVLIMEVAFEALREAGVRLPRQIGSAISIVGALVIGQAAVQAGLVSAPMVIVVAITGIASFMLPRYITGMSIRILRFPLIFLGGTLGLLGVVMGVIVIVIHLCTLRSLGEPYLAPLAPLKKKELKDMLWRAPWWMMNTRPHFTGESNAYRQSPHQAPNPERDKGKR